MPLLSKLKKTVIASGGIRALNAVFGIVNAALLARLLGVDEFGEYAFTYALVLIIAIPASMGIPQFVLRETAYASSQNDSAQVLGVWKWAMFWVLAISFAVPGVIVAGLLLYPDYTQNAGTLLTGLLLVPLFALGNLRSAALRGLGKVVLGQFPELVLRPASFAVCLVFMLWSGYLIDARIALLIHACAGFFAFAIGTYLLQKEARLIKGPATKFGGRTMFVSAMSIGLISGLTIVNNNIDILMVKYFLENEDVGHYRVASILSGFTLFGLQVIGIVVAPRIARLYKQGDLKMMESLVKKSNRMALCFGLGVLLVLVFSGKFLLESVFGAAYLAAFGALLILSAAQTINSGFGIAAKLMNMTGFERFTLVAITTAVCCNVILNAVLIQIAGIEGAAIGTLISLLTYKLILLRMIRVKLGVRTGAI